MRLPEDRIVLGQIVEGVAGRSRSSRRAGRAHRTSEKKYSARPRVVGSRVSRRRRGAIGQPMLHRVVDPATELLGPCDTFPPVASGANSRRADGAGIETQVAAPLSKSRVGRRSPTRPGRGPPHQERETTRPSRLDSLKPSPQWQCDDGHGVPWRTRRKVPWWTWQLALRVPGSCRPRQGSGSPPCKRGEPRTLPQWAGSPLGPSRCDRAKPSPQRPSRMTSQGAAHGRCQRAIQRGTSTPPRGRQRDRPAGPDRRARAGLVLREGWQPQV